ncbi:PDZ domain-containing protein [Tsuneonella sp. HG249]
MLLPAPAVAGLADDRASLAQLQREDLRLQTISWKLATANAPYCAARPAVGLLLQDMANYGQPARMRAAAGIAGDVAVQAVVPGSPAAQAGLSPNAEIVAIDGRAMSALPAAKPDDWRRLTGLHTAIEEALARDAKIRIAWREGGSVREATLEGAPACPTRFELLDSGGRAVADGTRVVMGRKFAGFGYPEDELAAALAHEFAHNLLAHRKWLAGVGRRAKNIRLTEREADRLMPWLLANAGYPPDAALRFFRKWGPGNDGWIFRAPTHDGWDERAEFVAGELPEIARLMTASGSADWRTHFRRETAR